MILFLLGYLTIAICTTPIVYHLGMNEYSLSSKNERDILIASFIASLLWPYIFTVRILKKLFF